MLLRPILGGVNDVPRAKNLPPRRFKKKSVRKIVEKRVAKAIEKYEKTRADSNNTGGSGSTNTRGTVVPEMHGSEDDKVKFAMCTFEGRALTCVERKCSDLDLLMLIISPGQCFDSDSLKGDDIEALQQSFLNSLDVHEIVPTEKKKI
ncbi:hypothetical protein Tco_0893813 [Tanacetum coccineum]|uniref:Uncharacterized protein n=1 Tax=Tanacetum coccineum TaxID=301880 RepID=A0ABQ5CA04_9ASTR